MYGPGPLSQICLGKSISCFCSILITLWMSDRMSQDLRSSFEDCQAAAGHVSQPGSPMDMVEGDRDVEANGITTPESVVTFGVNSA